MKRLNAILTIIAFTFVFAYACKEGGWKKNGNGADGATTEDVERDRTLSTTEEANEEVETPQSIKEGKGIGAIEDVDLADELDESMVDLGSSIYDMKCASCHKLTDQRVVGPGFAGITNRRKPEWIMNMITNTDVMLAEDPQAQKLLEECLTRMPNQNISVGDARTILEFMRKNDMEQVGKRDEAV